MTHPAAPVAGSNYVRIEPKRFARVIACAALAAAAAVCAAARPQSPGHATHRIIYPSKDWSLDVDLPDFEVIQDEFFAEDGRHWFSAGLKKDGKPSTPPVALFVALEPWRGAAGGAGLSAWAVERLKKNDAGSVKAFEHKGFTVVSYRRKTYPGIAGYPFPSIRPPVPGQRLIEAYLLKDDILITIRLWAESVGGREEQAFLSVLDSVRLADAAAPSTSFDLYHAGKARLLAKDYAGAARALGAALDLEKGDRRLGAEQWRDLIVRASHALAFADGLAAGRGVLEYGLANDPENPTFHLWLARAHAAAGDLDRTIASLEGAFRHRKNLPRRSLLLDPLYDPTFARFKDDEKFRKAVRAMKK